MSDAVDDFLNGLMQRQMPNRVDPQLLENALGRLSDKWLSFQGRSPAEIHEWGCDQFGINHDQINSPKEVRIIYYKTTVMLLDLFKLMKETSHPDDSVQNAVDGMVCNSHEEGLTRVSTFGRIMNLVHFASKYVTMSAAISSYVDDDSFQKLNFDEKGLQMFDDDDLKPAQQIIRYILALLSQPQRRARKFEDGVYFEIYTEHAITGKVLKTFAWKRECTIKQFIYDNISSAMDYNLWKKLTDSADNATRVSNYLEESSEPEFAELKYNSNYFSFQNGILDIDALTFFPFNEEDSWKDIAANAQIRMRIYEPEFICEAPDHEYVSMKFFDCEFNQNCDFEDILNVDASEIECNDLEKILSDQNLEEDTIYWFFVFMGRLMFKVGEKDNWQVLMYLKGVAGSGKSTISQLAKYLYTADQVGVLSSNAEEKFGLAPLYDKKLVICPEAKRNFSISQGDLQSMVSGEDVSVAIKHKTAKTVEWQASLMFCGNEIPNWQDASGSMTRRLLMFMFNKKIKNTDTEMTARLRNAIGQFIFRASLSYRQAVIRYGKRSIWDKDDNGSYILSNQLHDFKDDVAASVQPLTKFLKDSGIVVMCHENPDLAPDNTYMPENVFITNFKSWCKEIGLDIPVWNRDSYGTIFSDYGIERKSDTMNWEGNPMQEWFLIGVGLANFG